MGDLDGGLGVRVRNLVRVCWLACCIGGERLFMMLHSTNRDYYQYCRVCKNSPSSDCKSCDEYITKCVSSVVRIQSLVQELPKRLVAMFLLRGLRNNNNGEHFHSSSSKQEKRGKWKATNGPHYHDEQARDGENKSCSNIARPRKRLLHRAKHTTRQQHLLLRYKFTPKAY